MTETALILLLKLSEIPKSYIYTFFLILADCHTRGITLIACPILIGPSLQSLRSLLRPQVKITS